MKLKAKQCHFKHENFVVCLKRDFNKKKMPLNIIQSIELSLRAKNCVFKQRKTTETTSYSLHFYNNNPMFFSNCLYYRDRRSNAALLVISPLPFPFPLSTLTFPMLLLLSFVKCNYKSFYVCLYVVVELSMM